MQILIFDMDGVLLRPQGYHRALKETVRLAGISVGLGEVLLGDEQIAKFEALGISSEWHSSALCMAVMALQKQAGKTKTYRTFQPVKLDLEGLFDELAAQPMQDPALKRGIAAIEKMAAREQVPFGLVRSLVEQSESIQHSATMNWFQELVLGSDEFRTTYRKTPQFQQESYLKLYDQKLLNETMADTLLCWTANPDHGAAIMTNRPSSGPEGFDGAPDAEMGKALVGLEPLPLIGYSEIVWLAGKTGRDAGELTKPGWAHALTAILCASGWSVENSLAYTGQALTTAKLDGLSHLENCTIAVFEDTPGGMVAVQEAGALLSRNGIQVEVQKVGIAEDKAKQSALSGQDAAVYSDINMALAHLDGFSAFSGN